MYDRYNRHINYLRISVTDRCNLRCSYCMPSTDIRLFPAEEILSYDEIAEVVKAAVGMGIRKFRLTGGEPLVRKDIVKLVAMLSAIEGVKELVMTTNGTLLAGYAAELKKAGLQSVNISLDTLDPATYAELTGGGRLGDVLRGIEAALACGLTPVKINCVVEHSSRDGNARAVKAFCLGKGLQVRFIRKMNLSTGDFAEVEGGEGGACARCNRLRITSNGMIRPCLFDEKEFAVRTLGAQEALLCALQSKPAKGSINRKSTFYNTGG